MGGSEGKTRAPAEPRFLVDIMLGKLAKWLRILGYDTMFEHMDDQLVLETLRRETRILLSRDRELVELAGEGKAYYVRSQRPQRQVAEVVRAFGLDPKSYLFTRCSLCNTPVDRLEKEAVVDRVPPLVLEAHDEFWYCPNCDQVYWKGSHFERAQAWLEKALAESGN